MKLYIEYLNEDTKKDTTAGLLTTLMLLIRFFRSKHNIGLKITIGILVSVGVSSVLLGLVKSLNREIDCNKFADPHRKQLCKKTFELQCMREMISVIETGINKLDHKKPENLSKIEHLKKRSRKIS